MQKILRQRDLSNTIGLPKGTLWTQIYQGTFPRPVKLGLRVSGWLEGEVTSVLNARIAGASDDEIKVLVERIHTNRTGV